MARKKKQPSNVIKFPVKERANDPEVFEAAICRAQSAIFHLESLRGIVCEGAHDHTIYAAQELVRLWLSVAKRGD